MKRGVFIFFIVGVLVFGITFPINESEAQFFSPFGGQIVFMIPCYFPFGGFYVRLGPPRGGGFIYQQGLSKSYPYGPPSHIGQWLLGLSSGFVTCWTRWDDDGWRDPYSGGVILFHGSSL